MKELLKRLFLVLLVVMFSKIIILNNGEGFIAFADAILAIINLFILTREVLPNNKKIKIICYLIIIITGFFTINIFSLTITIMLIQIALLIFNRKNKVHNIKNFILITIFTFAISWIIIPKFIEGIIQIPIIFNKVSVSLLSIINILLFITNMTIFLKNIKRLLRVENLGKSGIIMISIVSMVVLVISIIDINKVNQYNQKEEQLKEKIQSIKVNTIKNKKTLIKTLENILEEKIEIVNKKMNNHNYLDDDYILFLTQVPQKYYNLIIQFLETLMVNVNDSHYNFKDFDGFESYNIVIESYMTVNESIIISIDISLIIYIAGIFGICLKNKEEEYLY